MMRVPDLPVLPDEDSLLSRKFGHETVNYFSGSPLNRLSFLRADHAFLQAAFSHPSAAFLLMNNLSPLVQSDAAHLAFVSSADILPLTGPEPFARSEEELIRDFNSEETRPVILFLGVDDKNHLPSHNAGVPEEFIYKDYKGSPYFAVDVTPRGTLTEAMNTLIAAVKKRGYSFHDNSPRHMGLHAGQGTISPTLTKYRETNIPQPPPTAKPGPSSTGTHETLSAHNADRPLSPSTPVPSASVPPPTSRVAPPGTANPAPPAVASPT